MTGVAENHNSTLPSKEAALFKRLLKMYEQKQYKTALKIAKQILSNPKCADHGETLAMKGLTLSYMGRKEEAYEDVRRGLKHDLKSYVCWHIYGLLQKGDKKYEEAMKCYVNALKFDKDNLQILRDLATSQIQLRDLEGFRDTRYRIAALRPSQRSHWLAYAVALHLQGELQLAVRVMEECRKLAHPERMDECDVEYGEYILYQLELMVESGSYNEAVEHSLRYESYVYDQLSLLEARVKCYLALGNTKESNSIVTGLITRNPENWSYYRLLTFPLDGANNLMEFCLELQKSLPHARTPLKIPLTLSEGDEFRRKVRNYLALGFRKGLPALFNDIKVVFQTSNKAEIVEEETLRLLEECRQHLAVPPPPNGPNELPASTILWIYYFLAQHRDLEKDYQKAMEYVEMAIEHTPTLVEAYCFKAKILKHMGSLEDAANCMEEAQSFDTSDRFINYKTGKYMLRANLFDRAEAILSRFTREGIKASESLCDMQCFWYMIESARALKRVNRLGDSLKLLHLIDRHFLDIVDDQLDFHAYCLRKSTIRSYVALLRMEDSVRIHKFYVQAAILAAEIYLQINDKQPNDSDEDGLDKDPSLSAAEKKKLRNKQRKAKKKAEEERVQQEAADKVKVAVKVKKDDDEPAAAQKEDLIPEKLARPEDPLEQACYFLRPLLPLDVPSFDLQRVIFETYYKKGKYAVAVQALWRMVNLDPSNEKLSEYRTMCMEIEDTFITMPDAIRDSLQHTLSSLLHSSTTSGLQNGYAETKVE